MLREVTVFLKDRKPDKAMNRLTDKIFIMKTTFRYGKSVLSKTLWYSEAEKSDSGQRLFSTQNEIQREYENVKKEFSADRLKKNGRRRRR